MIPLGQKRKRGRPKKTAAALQHQPNESIIEPTPPKRSKVTIIPSRRTTRSTKIRWSSWQECNEEMHRAYGYGAVPSKPINQKDGNDLMVFYEKHSEGSMAATWLVKAKLLPEE